MKLLLLAVTVAATASTLAPPDWLYPVPGGSSSPPPPATVVTAPGSRVTLTAGDLLALRTVEAAEWAGGEVAKNALTHWASGAPGARLTREAAAALRRLQG